MAGSGLSPAFLLLSPSHPHRHSLVHNNYYHTIATTNMPTSAPNKDVTFTGTGDGIPQINECEGEVRHDRECATCKPHQ